MQTERQREVDDLKAAGREIWESVQFYLQEHQIEELRAHLADKLELFNDFGDAHKLHEQSGFVCVRGEWIPSSKVRFIDISEGFDGRDVMTFEFEGEQFESHVIVKEVQK
jgi:hypothetical protein